MIKSSFPQTTKIDKLFGIGGISISVSILAPLDKRGRRTVKETTKKLNINIFKVGPETEWKIKYSKLEQHPALHKNKAIRGTQTIVLLLDILD